MSNGSGIGRRGFLRCMAWAGTGLVWTVDGGILRSRTLADEGAAKREAGAFRFVQISDTHMGFKGDANPEADASFARAIARIQAVAPSPPLLLHTGDVSHSQKAGAFDTVAARLQEVRAGATYFIPGEHDVFVDGGKEFLARFGAGTRGNGWRSFDLGGVHFAGLVNVLAYKGEGIGMLGADQLAWLRSDLESLSASTPVVLYAHVPLWSVYPKWGWATADGEQALSLVRRFGSVTVLNGHIHQILQKVEGNVAFHTAASTAFPQPAPGAAPAPGPMKVPAERLGGLLGVRSVTYVPRAGPLAVVDHPLV
jgi:3',5'-cyclic AMP phosphodiesterase CpdA